MTGARAFTRASWLAVLMLLTPALCSAAQSSSDAPCGDVVTIRTHDGTTTRVAFIPPPSSGAQGNPITLGLLAGGSGHVDLDDRGCPRALKGNSLIRSIATFTSLGFGTALIDAPSDHHGEDGLAGFRIAPQHAQDLAAVIADLRARTKGTVWLAGTSRGSISAANAAARLTGEAGPDGVVLTSALMVGQAGARKGWVAQTIFDVPLENIRIPTLLIGHAADKCLRSPADVMPRIVARTRGVRQQVVTVSGGPGYPGTASLNACEGRAPHGFVDQEAEVATGIARFIRGGNY